MRLIWHGMLLWTRGDYRHIRQILLQIRTTLSDSFNWQLNVGLDLNVRKYSPQIALFTSLTFLKCNFTVATYTTNSAVTLRLRSQYSRNVFTMFQRWRNFLAFGSKILPPTTSAPLNGRQSKSIDIYFFFNKLYFEEEQASYFSLESFHCPLQIFFLDSISLRHILPPQPVSSLPVVLGLEPELLEPAGGAGHGAGGEPGRGQDRALAITGHHARGDLGDSQQLVNKFSVWK